ncbi:CLUMA_CG009186, isoform A [Clunio marinus]|uniref:CLUMA_CG009186, isoform A n=1 Tax=Clunio marinus TaxID=568069 RepID=A0A1J1IBB2_9DIPT|nr:CLUMA_CG009186, isoform A [Clunio marinus]
MTLSVKQVQQLVCHSTPMRGDKRELTQKSLFDRVEANFQSELHWGIIVAVFLLRYIFMLHLAACILNINCMLNNITRQISQKVKQAHEIATNKRFAPTHFLTYREVSMHLVIKLFRSAHDFIMSSASLSRSSLSTIIEFCSD